MTFRLAFRALTAALIFTIPSTMAAYATEYRGAGYLSDWEGCEEIGWSGNVGFNVRLRPAGLPNNNAVDTTLGIIFPGGAVHFVGPLAMDGTSAPMVATHVWNWVSSQEVQARILPARSTDLSTAPRMGFVEFSLMDFEAAGCNVRGTVAVAQR